jgi:hypothetical protein
MVIVAPGVLDGTDRSWRDHHGRCGVVPATATMAVTADARVQAAAGEGMTLGRRVRTGPHGQGRVAETQRLATEVVGMTGLTTDDQYATPEPGCQHHRRDFQANPIHAVVGPRGMGGTRGPWAQPSV